MKSLYPFPVVGDTDAVVDLIFQVYPDEGIVRITDFLPGGTDAVYEKEGTDALDLAHEIAAHNGWELCDGDEMQIRVVRHLKGE